MVRWRCGAGRMWRVARTLAAFERVRRFEPGAGAIGVRDQAVSAIRGLPAVVRIRPIRRSGRGRVADPRESFVAVQTTTRESVTEMTGTMDCAAILRRTIAHDCGRLPEKYVRNVCEKYSGFTAENIRLEGILMLALRPGLGHIVAARYCGSSSAKPPPFLGVSSLNLAAPSGAAFFLSRGSFASRCARLSRLAHVLAHAPGDAPSQERKSLALMRVLFRRQGQRAAAEKRRVDRGQTGQGLGQAFLQPHRSRACAAMRSSSR